MPDPIEPTKVKALFDIELAQGDRIALLEDWTLGVRRSFDGNVMLVPFTNDDALALAKALTEAVEAKKD